NITNTALKAANVLAAVVIPTGATKKIFDKSNVEVTGVDAVVPLGGKIVVTSQDTKNTSTYSVVSDSMDTSITSTGFGGVIDPEAKAINNITLGVPFTEFLTSVVTKNNTAAKTVVKADGSSAGDTTALRIDAKTATEYKIKVSSADSQFSTLYSIGIAAAANKNYEFLDTTTKYGKTSGKIPESTAGYWGGGSLTEAGAYAIGTEGASGKAVKIATTADVETTGTFLQYYDAKLDINGTDSYSISMDVRPSENISFEVSGRYNSVSGPFLSNIVRFDSKTKKITAGETVSETDPGTYIELGDYMPNTWYNVSYSFNVSTKLADVWVNGVKVRTDYPIATPDAGTEATIMIPFMKFINTVKAEDYVCFDNITFQKVYDTHTNGQLGNPVINDEVKLYAN
ncbi:MAG: hypothetical protein RSC29_07345, partial [Oscillospiraceae bacterium]